MFSPVTLEQEGYGFFVEFACFPCASPGSGVYPASCPIAAGIGWARAQVTSCPHCDPLRINGVDNGWMDGPGCNYCNLHFISTKETESNFTCWYFYQCIPNPNHFQHLFIIWALQRNIRQMKTHYTQVCTDLVSMLQQYTQYGCWVKTEAETRNYQEMIKYLNPDAK